MMLCVSTIRNKRCMFTDKESKLISHVMSLGPRMRHDIAGIARWAARQLISRRSLPSGRLTSPSSPTTSHPASLDRRPSGKRVHILSQEHKRRVSMNRRQTVDAARQPVGRRGLLNGSTVGTPSVSSASAVNGRRTPSAAAPEEGTHRRVDLSKSWLNMQSQTVHSSI